MSFFSKYFFSLVSQNYYRMISKDYFLNDTIIKLINFSTSYYISSIKVGRYMSSLCENSPLHNCHTRDTSSPFPLQSVTNNNPLNLCQSKSKQNCPCDQSLCINTTRDLLVFLQLALVPPCVCCMYILHFVT